MVKKQNNNAWIVYVVALIAIVALILGAIALNKANVTGQGIFDFLKKSNNGETDSSSVCVSNEGGGCNPLPCCASKGLTCSSENKCIKKIIAVDYGMLGGAFIAAGNDAKELVSYEVKYDENGKMIYEKYNSPEGIRTAEMSIIDGKSTKVSTLDPLGEGLLISCTASCTGNWCRPVGCLPDIQMGCVGGCTCVKEEGASSCSSCSCSQTIAFLQD